LHDNRPDPESWSDLVCQKAMSAALLNITRVPLPPWLRRILPPLRARWSAIHSSRTGSSAVRPSNSSTPAISSSL
jgi:hypothetical protein